MYDGGDEGGYQRYYVITVGDSMPVNFTNDDSSKAAFTRSPTVLLLSTSISSSYSVSPAC